MSKKILAMPLENGNLAEHFGHSREFVFFKIEDSKIVKEQRMEPPPHAEGTIPKWLVENGATDVLVGGIGPKAVEILYNHGINVYVGVAVDEAMNLTLDFINGDLKFGQNFCHH
ncbi:MAG TPA: ATPase [Bacteroidetes bacterium]|nr:ATPase [Bacteroidota bacterium]